MMFHYQKREEVRYVIELTSTDVH
jgi:hypothetical protein